MSSTPTQNFRSNPEFSSLAHFTVLSLGLKPLSFTIVTSYSQLKYSLPFSKTSKSLRMTDCFISTHNIFCLDLEKNLSRQFKFRRLSSILPEFFRTKNEVSSEKNMIPTNFGECHKVRHLKSCARWNLRKSDCIVRRYSEKRLKVFFRIVRPYLTPGMMLFVEVEKTRFQLLRTS